MQFSLKSIFILTGVIAFFLAVFAFIGFQHKILAWVYLFAVLTATAIQVH